MKESVRGPALNYVVGAGLAEELIADKTQDR